MKDLCFHLEILLRLICISKGITKSVLVPRMVHSSNGWPAATPIEALNSHIHSRERVGRREEDRRKGEQRRADPDGDEESACKELRAIGNWNRYS